MKLALSIFILVFSVCQVFGQSAVQLSRIHSNIEVYEFNGNEQAIHWVTNGKINFSQRDFLNVEVIGGYYDRDGLNVWTPGDFSLTYTRKYPSQSVNSAGWQGVSPMVKLIMPTGNPENAAIFGHWILEPSVQYSWKLSDDRFFIRHKWRYNFPLINMGNWAEPPIFIRFEPQIGFQNQKWSLSTTLDNRMVFNQDAYVIFARMDAKYKINAKSGVYTFYTKRIRETALFKTYAGLGFYLTF